MSIIVNNGVQNILGTPGAISGVFADRPAAIDIAPGTLYFSTDTVEIYQVVAGSWILYTGGGGGGTSTGINGLNGTTNIGLGGTLINDTIISGDNYSLTFDQNKSFVVNSDSFNVNSPSEPNTFFNILPAVAQLKCFGAGFNLQNNVTILGDWDGNLQGTKIFINPDVERIQTQFGGYSYGLLIDTTTTTIGDYGNAFNKTKLLINPNGIINTSLFDDGNTHYSNYGYYIDYNNGDPYTVIGDYFNENSGTRMYITEDRVITTALGVVQKGCIVDFNLDRYTLGDFNGDTHGLCFVVENNNFETYSGKTDTLNVLPIQFGLYVQQDNINFRRSGIGDVLDNFNTTSIIVDDLNQTINFTGNITSNTTPSGSSGNYLILYINGQQYKIDLLKP